VSFVAANFGAPASVSLNNELAEYLVLSTCGHVFDGWRYLSLSALALLNGARNHAIHLAYYAELRGALSILANSGVGVLRDKHFSLDGAGGIVWFKGRTHDAAWSALSEWAKISSQSLKVIDCFEAAGIPASEWADACSVAPSIASIATAWLRDWSVDLCRLKSDSPLRNEATYRPDLRTTAFDSLRRRELRFILETSSGCLFGGNGRFDIVDAILLHDLCEKACELRWGGTDPALMYRLWSEIFLWFRRDRRMSPEGAMFAIRTVRDAKASPAAAVIAHASPANATAMGILSRAFLLLRLSSALARRQWSLIRARAPRGASPWQSSALASFGLWCNLWGPSEPPADYGELDADRTKAEEMIEDWMVRTPTFSSHLLFAEAAESISNLCRFERVGLLAMTP
jgi:hypothetical protein